MEDPEPPSIPTIRRGTVPGSKRGGNWPRRWQVAVGSTSMEGGKRDDVGSVVASADRRGRLPIHHRIERSRGGPTMDNMELLHANRHRQIHVRRADKNEPRPAGTFVNT